MKNKVDIRGGNGDIIFDVESGTAKKYLRNNSSKEKLKRFERELQTFRLMQERNIPNIVTIIDVYIDETDISNSYIEMEKCDGCLYDIYDATKGDVNKTLSLILPIIKTLYVLFSNSPQIIYRDIKPDNILFKRTLTGYELYLTDFGTCFLKDDNERITPEMIAVGPRMFIAPEYEIGKVELVNEKGDIFSIGKVIWSMICGEKGAFLPSNYWFVDEYNLSNIFPDNPNINTANMIIGSCLSVDPNDRCDYPTLIAMIESFLEKGESSVEEETQAKIMAYQEKRAIELIEIRQKNKLIVNTFSQFYVEALMELNKRYHGFELLEILLSEYTTRSKDGVNYSSINVYNNSAHYLYSRSYDRIYIDISYHPAQGKERYCNLSFSYSISSGQSGSAKFYYSNNGAILYDYQQHSGILTVQAIKEIVESMLILYTQ